MPPLLMEIGSLHNVLVINSEHTGTYQRLQKVLCTNKKMQKRSPDGEQVELYRKQNG